MKHASIVFRVASLFLCLSLLLLPGCKSSDGNGINSKGRSKGVEINTTVAATSKYVEKKMNFPNLLEVVAFNYVGENTYYVLGQAKLADKVWEYQVWRSTDGCETWERQSPKWLKEDIVVSAAAFTPKGDAYLFCAKEADYYRDRQTQLAFGDSNGLKILGNKETSNISNLALTDGGELLVSSYSGDARNTEQRNLETGKKRTYNFVAGAGSGRMPGVFTTFDDTLAVYSEDNNIVLYDLNTGKETEKIPCKASTRFERIITLQTDKSGFFYCDNGGIYRMTMDGSITEKLVSSNAAAFQDELLTLNNFFQRSDGALLLLLQNEDNTYQLVKYSYDSTVPAATVIGVGATPVAAVGKYVETKMNFPDIISLSAFDYVGNDTYYAMGIKRFANDTWKQEVWRSTDGCETWQKQTPKWLKDLGKDSITAAAFTPEGSVYIIHSDPVEYRKGIPGNRENLRRLAFGDSHGLKDIGGKETDKSAQIHRIALTDDGDLLVSYYSKEEKMEQRNLNTGTKRTYNMAYGSFTTFDSTLAVAVDANSILLYDLSTGKQTGKLPCKPSYEHIGQIAVQHDKDGLLYSSDGGIYRMAMDGSRSEKLITGTGAAFEGDLPTGTHTHLNQRSDGALLLLRINEDYKYELYKYASNAPVPSVANMGLAIHS